MNKDALLNMLASGRDNPMLRLSLGTLYLGEDDAVTAAEYLRKAIELDPAYSAAYKLLGKALLQAGRTDDAEAAWHDGLAVAERRGDMQTVREITVFLKRIAKARNAPD
ncbi:tetratricopeptide repeat protein [Jeongeupia naejangsanensis]|uniref:Tetratricopeptide repeat protein n=1 Tax=Jeongeupia naejangsanensis TaxID=613195 RepID=A0ABS2BL46_9NEIS|nr:tetratricopeptide repeat protein [Jeongeupia naejangsanensis]MBM3116337.1 tetratricopeptide repeat protein [Jeongeupia naejangsanensis]